MGPHNYLLVPDLRRYGQIGGWCGLLRGCLRPSPRWSRCRRWSG